MRIVPKKRTYDFMFPFMTGAICNESKSLIVYMLYEQSKVNPININIFIESFDGISFSINEMNRNTLKIKTLKEITAVTEEELNKKINDTMRNRYGITA